MLHGDQLLISCTHVLPMNGVKGIKRKVNFLSFFLYSNNLSAFTTHQCQEAVAVSVHTHTHTHTHTHDPMIHDLSLMLLM